MELPNIIDKLTHSPQKEKKEYFWALEIWNEVVKSAIWTIDEGKTKVMAIGSHEIWEDGIDELAAAVDRSFITATERFIEEGEEASKVIFGLAEDWVQEDKILSDRQRLLQDVCERLELKPVGFVSTFDAITHHLREVEGAPLSAILISPGRKSVFLAVVKIGKILGVEKISRSENLAADVYEGLLRMQNIETLPSRMILFNSEDMESLRQILIAHQWLGATGEKRLSFLHFPKIEVLPSDFDVTSVSIAGGGELAKSWGYKVSGGEILESAKIVEEEKKNELVAGEADLGFIKSKDVTEQVVDEGLLEDRIPSPIEEQGEPSEVVIVPSRITLPGISGGPIFLLLLGIILLTGLSLVGFIWYIPKANILIYVVPKFIEKEINLTVDPNQEVIDEANFVLPGHSIEIDESGEKSTTTTGEKTVGDKAKGEVTVFNRTDAKKTFIQGTTIVGSGGLKFSLDQDVTVASKTPDLVSGVDKWGESRVGGTALDIGAAYNLAKGTQFSFKDFPLSSYLARNDSAFSGGTSRQVQAIAEKDRTSLLKSLTDELGKNVKDKFADKISTGQRLIEESISTKETSTDFDHKVGEEAQSLSLKLSIRMKALIFEEDKLLLLIKKSMFDEVSAGYELTSQDIKSQLEVIKRNDDGSILFKAKISADLLPKIDKGGITSILKGRTKGSIDDYLRSNIPGYQGSEVIITPRLSSLIQMIPRKVENIKIELRSK